MKKLFFLGLLCGCSTPAPVAPPLTLQSQMQEDMRRSEQARQDYLRSPAGQKAFQDGSNIARRQAEMEAARQRQMDALRRPGR